MALDTHNALGYKKKKKKKRQKNQKGTKRYWHFCNLKLMWFNTVGGGGGGGQGAGRQADREREIGGCREWEILDGHVLSTSQSHDRRNRPNHRFKSRIHISF